MVECCGAVDGHQRKGFPKRSLALPEAICESIDLCMYKLFWPDLTEHRLQPSATDVVIEHGQTELASRSVQDANAEGRAPILIG